MSKQAANFEGGKKNRVYHFIQELIREGKYAWFVNREGRFRINWKGAVELYIQYRAKKDPGFDSSIDRKKASNSFREALLRRYCDDGAKEYEECQKLGEKKKVVEREFQMPSKVFHSLFGSREELPGDQSESSGISVGDPELTQEDKFLQLLGDLDYEVDMEPNESRLEGGRPFRVSFHPCLDANVTSVHAVFVKSEDILGNVELFISPSCLFGHSIPGAPSSGWAIVIFKDQNDTHLGSTEIFYFPDGVEAVAMIQTPDQFKNFCEEMSFHTASSFDSSDGDALRYGAFGNAQQVQFLCLLIHTAAREGAQQFIEMIFSTSSGRLVFDAYKDIQPLPEVVARDHGHEKTACYLEDVTKRFSVRISASNEYPKKINWSELAQAAEEAQRCNAENESCHLMSDLLKDAGYLGDLETSSSEPHSSGSEDEIAIASKKVVQDVCPSFGPSKKSKEHVDCDKISPQTMKLTTPAKSEDEEDFRGMPSHDDGTSSGYFLDADTSSCGSFEVDCESCDSEDCDKISPQTIKLTTPELRLADADTFSCASFEVDSERSDSGDAGSFTQDIKPTEKEFSSLNPPVEPSSEETTQFDQPEDEEKTSFIKTSFQSFIVFKRFLIVSAFFCLIVGGMYLQIPFRSLSSESLSEISGKVLHQSDILLVSFSLVSYLLLCLIMVIVLLYTRMQSNFNANSCPNVFPSKRRHTGLQIRPDLLEEEIELFDRRGNRVCASMTVITKKKA